MLCQFDVIRHQTVRNSASGLALLFLTPFNHLSLPSSTLLPFLTLSLPSVYLSVRLSLRLSRSLSLPARKRRVSLRARRATRAARAANLTKFGAYESVSAPLGIVAAPPRKVPDRSEIVSHRRFQHSSSFSPAPVVSSISLSLSPRGRGVEWDDTLREVPRSRRASFTSVLARPFVRKGWIDLDGSSVALPD